MDHLDTVTLLSALASAAVVPIALLAFLRWAYHWSSTEETPRQSARPFVALLRFASGPTSPEDRIDPEIVMRVAGYGITLLTPMLAYGTSLLIQARADFNAREIKAQSAGLESGQLGAIERFAEIVKDLAAPANGAPNGLEYVEIAEQSVLEYTSDRQAATVHTTLVLRPNPAALPEGERPSFYVEIGRTTDPGQFGLSVEVISPRTERLDPSDVHVALRRLDQKYVGDVSVYLPRQLVIGSQDIQVRLSYRLVGWTPREPIETYYFSPKGFGVTSLPAYSAKICTPRPIDAGRTRYFVGSTLVKEPPQSLHVAALESKDGKACHLFATRSAGLAQPVVVFFAQEPEPAPGRRPGGGRPDS